MESVDVEVTKAPRGAGLSSRVRVKVMLPLEDHEEQIDHVWGAVMQRWSP